MKVHSHMCVCYFVCVYTANKLPTVMQEATEEAAEHRARQGRWRDPTAGHWLCAPSGGGGQPHAVEGAGFETPQSLEYLPKIERFGR